MKEEHEALLAGEMSGHIFFADRYYGFDDAIYAAARMSKDRGQSGKPCRASSSTDVPQTVDAGAAPRLPR
jgi:phosphomannomutase / phosphoglucomutase